ncbi:MAG: hypothetical protein E7042_05860 [Lentisphaerae bacterium]|nr:hypothetical protein [Lentisphaerota bacterium]
MFEKYDLSPAYPSTDRNTLLIYNSGSSAIRACTAVTLTGRTILNSGGYEQVIFGVIPATDDSGIWGIAAEDIAPGTAGNIVLNGVVRAFITSGGGIYAVPGKNGLTASDKGRHRILHRGNENNPGWVMMNSNKASEDYTGTFKLRWIKERTFELYNGAYPEITSNANSTRAGDTDLPGAEKVPRQFVYLPENVSGADVYLCACCNDGVYSTFVRVSDNDDPNGTPSPAGYFASVRIGDIYENGDVYQSFTSGGTIYFGKDWFL